MSATLRWSSAVLAIGGAVLLLWSQTRPEPAAPAAAQPARQGHVVAASRAIPVLATTSTATHEPTPREKEAEALSVFERERVDTKWATPRRSELATELDKAAGTYAHVRTIECRTTTCRAEVAVADNDAGATFVQSWLHTRTTGGGAYIMQGDGAVVMYIARGESAD